MFASHVFFLSLTLVVGVTGTRTARHIRLAKGGRADVWFMLALCWSPLVMWLLSLTLHVGGGR